MHHSESMNCSSTVLGSFHVFFSLPGTLCSLGYILLKLQALSLCHFFQDAFHDIPQVCWVLLCVLMILYIPANTALHAVNCNSIFPLVYTLSEKEGSVLFTLAFSKHSKEASSRYSRGIHRINSNVL